VSDDAAVAETVGAVNAGLERIAGVVTAAGIFHGPISRLAPEVSVDDSWSCWREPRRYIRSSSTPLRTSWTAVARS